MDHQEVDPLRPFDITLIPKDGKEFKAHRHVWSEASPFFKNLLENTEACKGHSRCDLFREEKNSRGKCEIKNARYEKKNARCEIKMRDAR